MARKEDKYTKRRIRSYYITSVFSISLVLFLLGLIGYLVLNTNIISKNVKENIGFTLLLKSDVNIESGDFLQFYSDIQRQDYIREIKLVDKDSALNIYKTEYEEDPLSVLEDNPLPHTIEVNLKAEYVTPDKVEQIITDLKSGTGKQFISSVAYNPDWIDKVNRNIMRIGMYILIFSAILFFISFLLINNTIRLSVYSKRFIIRTMHLVGASKSFIRRPFLWQGFLQGIYGAIVAIIMLSGMIYFLDKEMQDIQKLISLEQIDIIGALFVIVLILGVVISTISTYFSVNKYININKDNLYY